MDVLDARKRKSAFAAQLADQDAAMAQLQAKLEAARVEGERLKARAEEAPEAPAAAAAHADTSVAVVVSETPVVEAAAPSPAPRVLARALQAPPRRRSSEPSWCSRVGRKSREEETSNWESRSRNHRESSRAGFDDTKETALGAPFLHRGASRVAMFDCLATMENRELKQVGRVLTGTSNKLVTKKNKIEDICRPKATPAPPKGTQLHACRTHPNTLRRCPEGRPKLWRRAKRAS